MTDLTCTRRVHFSAGHRVMNHESKCATVHGHNYYVSIQAEASVLDDIGRVVDEQPEMTVSRPGDSFSTT
jgi:6-pyruvoyltetrahydropterin/6-carboxytetrahydropterin synthase